MKYRQQARFAMPPIRSSLIALPMTGAPPLPALSAPSGDTVAQVTARDFNSRGTVSKGAVHTYALADALKSGPKA